MAKYSYDVTIGIYDIETGELIEELNENNLRDSTACFIDTDLKEIMANMEAENDNV